MELSRILIVDDERPFLRSLATGLSSADEDYELLLASSGREAVELLNAHEVDLVLTDLKMPDMGGYELVAYLNRHHSAIPVILMTAYGTPELEQNFRVLGIYHYLEKPVDLQDVMTTVAAALSESKASPDSQGSGRSGRWLLGLLADSLERGLSGEVVVRRRTDSGRIFITAGKVTWVAASTAKQDLISYLVEHTELTQEDLTIVFDDCRRDAKDFGSTLVSWDMIDAATLHDTARGLICASLLELLTWDDTEAMFLPEVQPAPGLLAFGFDEVIEDLERLDAERTLGWPLRPGRLSVEPRSLRYGHSRPAPEEEQASPRADLATRDRDRKGLERDLERLAEADGFRAVGAFSPAGTLVAGVSQDNENLELLGALGQEILLEAQRLSDQVGSGDGITVRVSTPEVDILARAIHPAAAPPWLGPGESNLHVVLAMDRHGNVELARIQLNRIAREATVRGS